MAEERRVTNAGNVAAEGRAAEGHFHLEVAADGAISNSNFPGTVVDAGPTSSVFTITHSMSLTAGEYRVQCTVTGTAEGEATVTTRGADAITVTTFDESATPALADLPFVLDMWVGDRETGQSRGG